MFWLWHVYERNRLRPVDELTGSNGFFKTYFAEADLPIRFNRPIGDPSNKSRNLCRTLRTGILDNSSRETCPICKRQLTKGLPIL
jgi:hypothetical protein